MYKYLLWDIDGTVLDFLAAEKYAIRTLFDTYGIGTCTDSMLEQYSKINVKYWEALERGEMTKPEILVGRFREFFEKNHIDTGLAEMFNLDYQQTLGDCIVFTEDAKDVLREEKGQYVLVAVTNGTKAAQEKKLRVSGLSNLFDYVFISEDVGVEKPDPVYFEHVFQTVGITDKKEVLIIGDSLTSDMKGGITAGIDTCWFNPKHKENNDSLCVTYEIERLRQLEDILN